MTALIALCTFLPLAGPDAIPAARIEGDYIESRTADIYTGPCFANAEVFLTGHQAVLAWKVRRGFWDGVDLAGLTVAAAVKGTSTFSKDDPARAVSVVIVDQAASPAQRDALVSLAKHLGGARLANVKDVKVATLSLTVEEMDSPSAENEAAHGHGQAMPCAPRASFWAPGLAEILTRPLDSSDHLCGNEVVEYQPLSRGVSALPAYTLSHVYKGDGLGSRWDDHNCRSSFVGHFAD
jgi:hypothetical protein